MSATKPQPDEADTKRRLQKMRNFVNNLLRREQFEETSTVAAAVSPAREPRRLPIASRVELIEVLPTSPTTFRREDGRNFYCLDMEAFTLDGAIDWLRRAQEIDPFSENNVVPVIYVIGSHRPLTKGDLLRVNDALVPAGGRFYRRPSDAPDFESAMKALGRELTEQYGSDDQATAWRQSRRAETLTAA
jgi:hypothetical protein